MQTNIKGYGNGKAHLKCIICNYEIFLDSFWYINNYDEDKDGWFRCPVFDNDSLSVIKDYNKFKMFTR